MTTSSRYEQWAQEWELVGLDPDRLPALPPAPPLIVVSRSEVLARAQRDLTRSYGRTFAVPACLSSTRRRIGGSGLLWGVGVCFAVAAVVLVWFVGGLGR